MGFPNLPQMVSSDIWIRYRERRADWRFPIAELGGVKRT